jgi:hypothetical protein
MRNFRLPNITSTTRLQKKLVPGLIFLGTQASIPMLKAPSARVGPCSRFPWAVLHLLCRRGPQGAPPCNGVTSQRTRNAVDLHDEFFLPALSAPTDASSMGSSAS